MPWQFAGKPIILFSRFTPIPGPIGYGEVIPRPYLTGESIDSAWEDISSHYWPAVRGSATRDQQTAPGKLCSPIYLGLGASEKLPPTPGSIWPSGMPGPGPPGGQVTLCLDNARPLPVPLTGPLGEGSFRYLWRTTCLMKFLGFQHYKLKVGNIKDLAAVRLIRQIIGPRCDLRVDANGGWEVEQAIHMAKELRRFDVSSVEQPIPAGNVKTWPGCSGRAGCRSWRMNLCARWRMPALFWPSRPPTSGTCAWRKSAASPACWPCCELAGYPLPPALTGKRRSRSRAGGRAAALSAQNASGRSGG